MIAEISWPLSYTVIVVIVLVLAGFIFVSDQAKYRKRNLGALAERLHFTVSPNLWIPGIKRSFKTKYFGGVVDNPTAELGIAGAVHGRPIRFSSFEIGGGKTTQIFAEIAVAAQVNKFTFSCHHSSYFGNLLESSSDARFKINDEEFDRSWRLTTNSPTTLKALLIPELRKAIAESSAFQGEFYLEFDWLRYRELGDFSDAELVARYESMIGLMCDLAVASEVVAEKYSPPSPNSP